MHQILLHNFTAEAAITVRRILKPGAAEGTVVLATGPTDKLVAVADENADVGARVDGHILGVVDIDVGGAFGFGDPITSDANGKAVLASPAAGANNNIVGWARSVSTGGAGEIAKVQVQQGRIQG